MTDKQFQSTLPVGGATHNGCCKIVFSTISIHAPRGGSDSTNFKSFSISGSFQSTLPVGGATLRRCTANKASSFQSTLPVGGATVHDSVTFEVPDISIHAPRGGSDTSSDKSDAGYWYFNPRSPWGERPHQRFSLGWQLLISIHAPRGGSDPDTS